METDYYNREDSHNRDTMVTAPIGEWGLLVRSRWTCNL